ncbi:hypothetical protein HPT25_27070 [Bacillus sp. BRMEA1]|uniref:pre-toxin TG domain-containing protein n=1 Tax=Neobacillus endophyticus TaxID=2738405 RepID=UPI001565C7EA|nr:pre-toxin TG domain-containing protein [Neobacillus endophyticus]NRD80988.1 hypothetical protein [Neobacillus endophyticus]
MDVKYIPSDWKKMRDGIGDLIGLGRWGKGMIDSLKDISDNLDNAKEAIRKYDHDGVISFQHESLDSKYQNLYEDFEVLHSFTGKVGDIVDRTIDEPFYEEIDAFVEAMRDLDISTYTTTNRIGATETKIVYEGYSESHSIEVPKTEVNIDDLFNGDNFYSERMKEEYQKVKEKSRQNFSLEDYEQVALHKEAFQYESIRDRQDHKEFQTQMWLAGGTIVGAVVTAFCPPVGLALLGVVGVTSGALDIGAAVSGKDLISGRKLGTGERALRGAFGGLDMLPGLGSLSKLSGTIKLARFGDKMAEVGVETGVKEVARQENSNVIQLVRKTDPSTISRIKSSSEAISDRANVLSFNEGKVKLEAKRLLKEEEIIPPRKYALPMASGDNVGKVHIPSGNTHTISIDEIHGESVAGAVKGTGKYESTLDAKLEKYVCDSFEGTGKEVQDNFNKYLRENVWCDETLSNSEEIEIMKENFNRLTSEQKIDFNVLNDEKFLSHNSDYTNWGDWPPVNWPEFPGLDKTQSIISISKENPIPEKLDRIGSLYGNNFATIPENGIKHTMDERAICYIDNPEAYHKYTFESTHYIDCIDCIKNKDVDGLNKIIDEMNFKNIDSHIEHIDLIQL